MWENATRHFFTSGSGEGISHLNSFDNALIDAKIGNTNLIKCSSIVPAYCTLIEPIQIRQGMFLPVAYAYITSSMKGQRISAAVAVAYPEDEDHAALVMEFSAVGSKEVVEAQVRLMAQAGMEYREKKIKDIRSIAVEHLVLEYGSAFAAVVLCQ